MLIYIVISLAVLFILSGFFSGSEIAVFSLPDNVLKEYANSPSRSKKILHKMMSSNDSTNKLLIFILMGNTLVNFFIGSLGTMLFYRLSEIYGFSTEYAELGNIIVFTFLLVLLGEILPKMIAISNPERFATSVALPLNFLRKIFAIPADLSNRLSKGLTALLRKRIDKYSITEEELKSVVQESTKEGLIKDREKDIIFSIFEFSNRKVREIMTPRIDIIAVDINTPIDTIIKTFSDSGFSRLPVYEGQLDNLKGFLNSKDLVFRLDEVDSIGQILRKLFFVPEAMRIDALMKEMQKEKAHIAIVVDEYGNTSGLITLEDILEEIVGEIYDDQDEVTMEIRKIGKRKYILDGGANLADINRAIDEVDLPESEDFDSIGGFLIQELGKIPGKNDEFTHENLTFKILEAENRRITKIRLDISQKVVENDD